MSHRAAIFDLRAQVGPDGKPTSYAKIAAALGVSESLVAKELKRPGSVAIPDDPGGDGYTPPANGAADPEQQALNQDRIALQRARLRADRLEQDRRAALLENSGQGGGATMALLLDGQLQQLRAEIARLAQRSTSPPAPPPPPPPSLVDQLAQFRQVTETMQAFAPSRPPSSAVELELEAMRARLQMEDRERMRRLDIDERERMERAAGERARGEAIAKLIEGTGPLLAVALQKWMDQPAGSGNGAALAPADPVGRPLMVPTPAGPALAPGTITGPCPNCGAALRLRPEPGKVDRCPNCQLGLAVVAGEIQPRVPSEIHRGYAS